jgi:hypothetical protein
VALSANCLCKRVLVSVVDMVMVRELCVLLFCIVSGDVLLRVSC